MGVLTPVIHLIKPGITDIFDVATINASMDRIDTASVSNANSVALVRAQVDITNSAWTIDPDNTTLKGETNSYVVSAKYKQIGSIMYGRITISGGAVLKDGASLYALGLSDPAPKIPYPSGDQTETVGSCVLPSSSGRYVNGNVTMYPKGFIEINNPMLLFKLHWSSVASENNYFPNIPATVTLNTGNVDSMPNPRLTASFKYRVK